MGYVKNDKLKKWSLEAAEKVGLPREEIPPIVLVKDTPESRIFWEAEKSPTGNLIVIEEDQSVSEIKRDIRHELAHCKRQRYEGAERVSETSTERLARKELGAIITGEGKLTSRDVADVAAYLVQVKDSSFRDAWSITEREARRFGVSSLLLTKGKGLFKKWWKISK